MHWLHRNGTQVTTCKVPETECKCVELSQWFNYIWGEKNINYRHNINAPYI